MGLEGRFSYRGRSTRAENYRLVIAVSTKRPTEGRFQTESALLSVQLISQTSFGILKCCEAGSSKYA